VGAHVLSGPVDVAIVGGGPAGLAAAVELRRGGAGRVVVLEREAEPGGIPRHASHQGYGLRDLRRVMTGPRYAVRRTELAARAGAAVRVHTQVTGWSEDGGLEVTSPGGREVVRARAIVLATGCRERPRSARLVPGTRPQGVLTTGMLQQLVYLAGESPGRQAVVVGAEHVGFSALLTLAHGGARAVAMTTERPRHQSFAAFRLGALARFRVPLRTSTAVTAIRGRRRVEAVELTDLRTGAVESVDCDTVVFTGDWIPDHELAVLGGAALDAGTRGPAVDAGLRTTRPDVFAAGNVLHGAETADVAALSGRHAAAGVLAALAGEAWPAARVEVACEPPLHWIAPNAVTWAAASHGGAPPRTIASRRVVGLTAHVGPRRDVGPARGRYLLRAHEELLDARVELAQDGRTLLRARLPRVMPGRSASLPAAWTGAVDPAGGPVVARVVTARRRRRRPLG
jgi:thioredoxin reductase